MSCPCIRRVGIRNSVSHTITTGVTATRTGRTVTLAVHDAAVKLSDYWCTHAIGTLPAGWRPSREVSAPVAMAEMPTTARLSVDSSGVVSIKNMSGTAVPGSKRVYGCLTYICAI